MLWLAYAHGSTHDEIAGVIGVKTGSVKLMLFRARQRLADRLRARAGSDAGGIAMTAPECARETEIVDAIAAGQWPDAAPETLRAHVASCPVCADLALAASALHDDAAVANQAPMALPSAGQVWWRAELRARHEAARLAQRPVLAVQVVAAVVVLAALVTGVRALLPTPGPGWPGRPAAARTVSLATIGPLTLALVLSRRPVARARADGGLHGGPRRPPGRPLAARRGRARNRLRTGYDKPVRGPLKGLW